jgi:hypothetical protein
MRKESPYNILPRNRVMVVIITPKFLKHLHRLQAEINHTINPAIL